MLILKTYFQVLKKYSGVVILFTAILLGFACFNFKTKDNAVGFSASRPDIYVFGEEEETGLSALLRDYLEEYANIRKPVLKDGGSGGDPQEDEAVEDALFYRDVAMIIRIPEGFGSDFLDGKRPALAVRSTKDAEASYVEMQLERFLETAGTLQQAGYSEKELIKRAREILWETVPATAAGSMDSEALSGATFYYNFANYSLLAGCVYAIAMILSSFRGKQIHRRTVVSGMNYRILNRRLLLANSLFTLLLWGLYVLISMVLIKDVMFTKHGLCYMANSFVFACCALSVGFLIGNLVPGKEALSGVINVVALGSSFLCGAFVPVQWLPEGVLKAAHLLPSYWFIQNNELIRKMETVDAASIKPLLINGAVILLFAALFVALTNLLERNSRRRRA